MPQDKAGRVTVHEPSTSRKSSSLDYLSVAVPSLLYWFVCCLCLVQWQSHIRWVRFDLFSGSYLGLKLMGSIHSLFSGRGAFRQHGLRQEWWGATSGRGIVRSTVLLMLLDLLVFWDYGHWQTLRILAHPAVQGTGLGIYAIAKLWQMRTDSSLANYFAGANGPPLGIIEEGPYRHIRHPRYAAVIAGKFGCALIFASIFGWLALIAWATVYVRKVEQEEEHMKRLAPDRYESYSRATAKLIPGLY